MSKKQNRYPQLEIDLEKLRHNLAALSERCQRACIQICGVVKGFHGIPEVARVYEQVGIPSLGSSRLEQLRGLREAGITVPLMLIRVPMISEVEELVCWADLSLHSERETLAALNRAAGAVGKRHSVVLMVDLGDLREGFWDWEELTAVALEVEREMVNLHLAGVGTNLGCYGTIQATPEKMEQLVAAARKVEGAIGRKLEIVSGGASTSLHMILDGTMPQGINHLRLGESLLLGGIWGCEMDFLHRDVFTLRAQVIESKVKPSYPVGVRSVDAFGRTRTYVDRGHRRRALLAIGRADYGEPDDLIPRQPGIKVLGASSDHTILDVQETEQKVQTGDVVAFDLCYATMVYLTNSRNVHIICTHGEEPVYAQ